ncbi:hypothetical protein DCF83_17850 (plasmid) [Edwardsiella tarda]|uniref:hypothetical protein n=1 Tax=Edwardsiella tarda TaxID=636 RepID=UPI000D50641B|nr:hypothetical protein [Edwardsiella tarda]UCQ29537.1 hypothetical protein DCF83_17850 [Edwardsiella tarda]
MLFQYAIHKDTGKITHIDSVPNGKQCNCICKNCGDDLIAKNNGKIISHHFSHSTQEESRDCQMTQLHIGMQLYFSSLSEVDFSEYNIKIGEKNITIPKLTATIKKSHVEYRIGPYLADVYLLTDIGGIVIEICVTHKCEDNKRQYYIDHQIDSIEYYFPINYRDNLSECISLVQDKCVKFEWLYHATREKEIFKHLSNIKLKEQKKREIMKNGALRASQITLTTKKIHLPKIQEEMFYSYKEISFSKTKDIYPSRNIICNNVSLFSESDECIIIECCFDGKNIYSIFSFSDSIPDTNHLIDKNIICRHYEKSSCKVKWSWVRYCPDKVQKKREYIYKEYISECHILYHNQQRLLYIKNKVYKLSSEYSNNRDSYRKQGYGKWKKWMIKNKLFTPTPNKENPPFPSILKWKRKYPELWPFQTWDIILLSNLAEMIDKYPIRKKIYFLDLFLELERIHGLSTNYVNILSEFEELAQSTTFDKLIEQSSIIKEALSPYAMMELISIFDDYLIRKGSLLFSLKV